MMFGVIVQLLRLERITKEKSQVLQDVVARRCHCCGSSIVHGCLLCYVEVCVRMQVDDLHTETNCQSS